jgi:predicted SnoaL-like aldol condensation-catalyzing enzyme
MNLHLSKLYLSRIEDNSMQIAYQNGSFPDFRSEQMSIILTDHYSQNASKILSTKSGFADVFAELVTVATTKLLESRREPIAVYKKRIES